MKSEKDKIRQYWLESFHLDGKKTINKFIKPTKHHTRNTYVRFIQWLIWKCYFEIVSSFIFLFFPPFNSLRFLTSPHRRSTARSWRQTALFVPCEMSSSTNRWWIKRIRATILHSTYVSSFNNDERWEGPQKKICHIIISHSNVIIKASREASSTYLTLILQLFSSPRRRCFVDFYFSVSFLFSVLCVWGSVLHHMQDVIEYTAWRFMGLCWSEIRNSLIV